MNYSYFGYAFFPNNNQKEQLKIAIEMIASFQEIQQKKNCSLYSEIKVFSHKLDFGRKQDEQKYSCQAKF
jgi:hypothetical protein